MATPLVQELRRLITFLPYNLVEEVVVDDHRLAPRSQWVEGCLLAVQFTAVTGRAGRWLKQDKDEQTALEVAALTRALQRALEHAVFPRGGYLLKFTQAGMLVMFTSRCPGLGPQPWSYAQGDSDPASRAARCALELMGALEGTLGSRLYTLRAGVEMGRFRLVLAGVADKQLEQLPLGHLPSTVLDLRHHARPGEVVLGPRLVQYLSGWNAHIGPVRGAGRRLMSLPAEHAGPVARVADLSDLLARDPQRLWDRLHTLLPAHLRDRLNAPAEVRPLLIMALPVRLDLPDGLSDDEALIQVNSALAAVLQRVGEHSGTLLRTDLSGEGAAVLAVFGIGDRLRRAAREAAQCALELCRDLDDAAAGWSVCAAVEAGRVHLGELGSPLKREVAVMGEAVEAALALASQARPGQTLLGATAVRLGGNGLLAREVALDGDGQGHGHQELLAVEEPQLPPMGHATPAAPAGTRTALMEEWLQLLTRPEPVGRAFRLEAPAGSGSSAFVQELLERATAEGWRGAVSTCRGDAWHTLMAPVPEVLRRLLEPMRGASEEALLARIQEDALIALPQAERFPARLRQWLALPVTDLPGADVDAWSVILAVLGLRTRHVPMLVIVEDVHLADAETLVMLEALVRATRQMRLFVIMTGFPQARPFLADMELPTWSLPPLSEDEARARVLHALKVRDEKELGLTRAEFAGGVRAAHGHPRALEGITDLVKARLAQGSSPRVAWQETRDVLTKHELRQLKLDMLSHEQRQVVRVASVMGESFETLWLEQTLRRCGWMLPLSDLLHTLQQLWECGILEPAVVPGGVGYRFRSKTLRQTASSSVAPPQRAQWHGHAADALEALNARLGRPDPGRVAHHRLFSATPGASLGPTLEAVARRRAFGLFTLEMELLESACALAATEPAQRARLLQDLTLCQWRAGRVQDAEKNARTLLDDLSLPVWARPAGGRLAALLALERGDAASSGHYAVDGLRWLEPGAPEARDLVDVMEWARAAQGQVPELVTSGPGWLRALLLLAAGDRLEAEKILETSQPRDPLDPLARSARAVLLWAELEAVKRPGRALAMLWGALDEFQAQGWQRETAHALLQAAGCCLHLGEKARAQSLWGQLDVRFLQGVWFVLARCLHDAVQGEPASPGPHGLLQAAQHAPAWEGFRALRLGAAWYADQGPAWREAAQNLARHHGVERAWQAWNQD